jgi:hypothetical protein
MAILRSRGYRVVVSRTQDTSVAKLTPGDVSGGLLTAQGVVTVLGSALDSAALAYGHLILLGPAKPGYFSTPSQMPGALIEPLFVTDPFEGSIAASTHGQQLIATALAEAITQYFTQLPPRSLTPAASRRPRTYHDHGSFWANIAYFDP